MFFLLLQNYSFDVSFTASELYSKVMGLSETLGTVACRSLIHKNAMRYFRLKCSCTGISHLTTAIRNNPGGNDDVIETRWLAEKAGCHRSVLRFGLDASNAEQSTPSTEQDGFGH